MRKGGKSLLVALHPDARAAVDHRLADGRPALVCALGPAGDLGWLFPSQRDRRRPPGMTESP